MLVFILLSDINSSIVVPSICVLSEKDIKKENCKSEMCEPEFTFSMIDETKSFKDEKLQRYFLSYIRDIVPSLDLVN